MIISIRIFITALLSVASMNLFAQAKYQSLMWKISGNGLNRPSYLYGTMHISGKLVFHLGDQFYDAMEEVDVVALELEPEAWLEAIFKDENLQWYASSENTWTLEKGFGYEYESNLPQLKGFYKIDADLRNRITAAIMNDPSLLNYLLFRYNDYGWQADFEEDTWLDMYIYQTGKKLGKHTIGLESYEQSDYYIRQARKAELREKNNQVYDEGDLTELGELQMQLEPAYRRQDLDLIDSLNAKTTSKAFEKYILIERNKLFVHTIDSVLHSGKSLLAGMGCAHLPGDEGIIELLREKGYTVEAYNKGERNTRRRAKIDKMVLQRPYTSHKMNDNRFSFSTPSSLYYLGSDNQVASWITLDIPNGASFIVERIKTYPGITSRSQTDVLSAVDSVLYESVAGDIISQKRINLQGNPGIDVLNKTRRGDYQRRMIISLRDEIVVLKLTATGEKVKSGYGNEFFNSISFSQNAVNKTQQWTSADGSLQCTIPGSYVCYDQVKNTNASADFELAAVHPDLHSTYFIQRHTIEEPGFLDENNYELNRLADAWCEDNHIEKSEGKFLMHNGLPAREIKAQTSAGKNVAARFILNNLDYYAISSFADKQVDYNSFFESFQISRIKYPEFFSYIDTAMCFTAELPYKPEVSDENEFDTGWTLYTSDEPTKSIYEGKTANANFSPPGETQRVFVEFQRFHKYSDGEAKEKFVQSKIDQQSSGGLSVNQKYLKWNDKGFILDLVVGDTSTTRNVRTKMILHNKSFYTVTASYDSVTGPGDFLNRFFETFTPTDTVFSFYHFENRDDAFLDLMASTDSSSRHNAYLLIEDMDFSAECIPRIREIIKNPPVIEDDKLHDSVMGKLTRSLSTDTSAANLQFITELFYQNSDSSAYQANLLRAIAYMHTRAGAAAYRKLLLDEPPVNDQRNTVGFPVLMDSLELYSPYAADFFQLLSLDDYQEQAFEMIAEMVDSNLVSPAIYKTDVQMILLEAKNELKHLNAMEESTYKFDTENFLALCSLLQPYRKDKDVTAFFEKAYRTKKTSLLTDLVEFDLQHKTAVPDSILNRIFSSEKNVLPLCKILQREKLTARIPEKYSSREQLMLLYLKTKFDSDSRKDKAVDSLTVIYHGEKTIRNHSLDVFYVKYKKQKSKQWIGTVIAFDDKKKDYIYPPFLELGKTVVLDSDEDELTEMDKAYKYLEEINRKNLNYSGSRSAYDNYYWD